MRLGEIEAKKQRVPAFDKNVFKQVLVNLRGAMELPPAELKKRLIEECRGAGVAVVFVKGLPGTPVHGAVRWAGDTPVIQLSCRYKVEDIFWFTFFHEAGHVMLHGKRDVFLEENGGGGDKEQEADAFARAHLIPESQWRKFVIERSFSESDIRAFAGTLGISPGIVVGRLHHEKKLHRSRLNHLLTTIRPNGTTRCIIRGVGSRKAGAITEHAMQKGTLMKKLLAVAFLLALFAVPMLGQVSVKGDIDSKDKRVHVHPGGTVDFEVKVDPSPNRAGMVRVYVSTASFHESWNDGVLPQKRQGQL